MRLMIIVRNPLPVLSFPRIAFEDRFTKIQYLVKETEDVFCR